MIDVSTVTVSVSLSVIASVLVMVVADWVDPEPSAAPAAAVEPSWACQVCERPFASEYDAIEHARDAHNAPTDEDARSILEVAG